MGIRQTILIFGLAAATFAQDLTTKADEFVGAYAKLGKFSGTVLIAKEGKIVFEKAYGMANYEWSIPNTVDTKFRLGSISKQFGAAAILKLEEMGKLKTTDKACDYLPACPEQWKPITIHQLATHTSGVPNFTNFPDYAKIKYRPSRYEEQVKLVWEKPMDFDPGTKFQYSNTGYVILGQIIEKASGQPWERFLAEQIFVPAGMTNTLADSNTALVPKRAAGYRAAGGMPVNAEYIDMRIPNVAGALISTIEDLYKWDRALASGKLLGEAAMKKMFIPEKNNYAYGWVLTDQQGKAFQGHGGGIEGFTTQIQRLPSEQALLVVLSNFEDGQTGPVSRGLAQILNGGNPEIPKERQEIQIDSAALDEYVGTYQLAPSFALVVTKEGNQLITQATGQGKIPIFAESKDTFFPKAMPATLVFTRENGKVTGLILKQGGREMKAPRL
ncbi:MAG: serine hydrolase [Acidobacteria bacterium]|nr:serine hydrolase [Acidobacteriota bacterium]